MAVGFLRFQSSTTGMMNFLLSDFCRSLYDQQFENWIKRNFQNSMRMYKQNKVCAISLSAVYTLDAVVFLFPVSSLTTTTVDLPADIASSGRKKRERGDDENSIPTGWRLTLLLLASFFRIEEEENTKKKNWKRKRHFNRIRISKERERERKTKIKAINFSITHSTAARQLTVPPRKF